MSAADTADLRPDATDSIIVDFTVSVQDAQIFHSFAGYKRATRFEWAFRIAIVVLQTLIVISAVISIRLSFDVAATAYAYSVGSLHVIAALWLFSLAMSAVIYCASGIYRRSILEGHQTARHHHLEFQPDTIASRSDDGFYQTTYHACDIVRSGSNVFLMWTRLRGILIPARAITPDQIETILRWQHQTKVNTNDDITI